MRSLISLLLFIFFIATPASAQPRATGEQVARPQNVIMLIPDGFGPASATMARDYLRATSGISSLALDSLQVGSVRTYSTSNRVTDSAAGATAYAAGTKTYNGAIACDTTERPVATLLEAAEAHGMATGLVVTSRITHATPASFSAHVTDRWKENKIAAQQIHHGIEVIFGGGRRHFLPAAQGGAREDGRNLLDEATTNGYRIVTSRDALDQVHEGPVLGLFSMSHMDYEIDRTPPEQPSLAAMTTKALALLRDDPDGYFLMVEGSRIDHAGHNNDPAAHLHDILAFNEAARVALAAAREDGNTLVVSVSDHETGGMSLGRTRNGNDIYGWKPQVLSGVRSSQGVIAQALRHAAQEGRALRPVIEDQTGIRDLSDTEVTRLRTHLDDADATNTLLSEIVSRRALIGWTTGGHTAVDVNLYAYGPGWTYFLGNHDNTYVGQTIARLMGFDLSALTATLRNPNQHISTSGSR